ncbi:hypothetical protein ACFLYP_04175 [Chloroflexota bacterium]
MGDTISQVRSITNNIANDGREKFEEIKQHGQELAVGQLDKQRYPRLRKRGKGPPKLLTQITGYIQTMQDKKGVEKS